MPSQKFGVDRPQSANALAPTSHAVPRPTAETMPAGMPIRSAIAIASTRELDRHRQLLDDEVEHRLLRPHRFAEVAAQHAADPVAVAHRQRIVEVQLLVQVGDDVRVALLAGEDHRRIAGQQLLQPEDQHRDEDQRRQDRRDALDEELDHASLIVRSADERGAHDAIFRPVTRSNPSGMLRIPLSLALCAHSQLRW